MGCSPWGRKESDTNEQLTDTFNMCVCEGEAAGLETMGPERAKGRPQDADKERS